MEPPMNPRNITIGTSPPVGPEFELPVGQTCALFVAVAPAAPELDAPAGVLVVLVVPGGAVVLVVVLVVVALVGSAPGAGPLWALKHKGNDFGDAIPTASTAPAMTMRINAL